MKSLLLSATLVSAVGCSNSSNVGDFTFGHCVTPDGAVSMIYPEPNTTTVSTNFIQVVVASTSVSELVNVSNAPFIHDHCGNVFPSEIIHKLTSYTQRNTSVCQSNLLVQWEPWDDLAAGSDRRRVLG